MERITRKEWGIEDIGTIPSARAGNKPATLREGKLGSENPSSEGYVGGATLPYQGWIETGLPGRGHRYSGPKGRYSPSPVGKIPVPLVDPWSGASRITR